MLLKSDKIHFIHGGGYDLKNVENIEHKAELEACAQKLGLVEGANGDYQVCEKYFFCEKTEISISL